MWKTTLKLALRALWRNKGSTAINVVGLAAGLAVSCFVILLLWNQWTHDDFHPGADRLYRVTTEMRTDDETSRFASSSAGLAPVLRKTVAGVEAATRLRRGPSTLVPDGARDSTRRTASAPRPSISAQTFYAEASFFDLFGFELERGVARRLEEPRTAILSRKTAKRLFEDADPIGATVAVPGVGPIQVVGVVRTDAYRSHLEFDALLSFATLAQTRSDELEDWTHSAYSYYTYARLGAGTTPEQIRGALEQVHSASVTPDEEGQIGVKSFHLQSVGSILTSRLPQNEIAEGPLPPVLLYVLSVLALVVLLAAGFNYVNLTTARGMTRGKEVGVRKTMGARRSEVMLPFVVESVVTALLALVLGIALMAALIPTFNRLWSVQQLGLTVDLDLSLAVYGAFVGGAVVVGLLAGLYPAWNLSRFQAAEVLRAGTQSAADEPTKKSLFSWISTRKALIVVQFTLSIVVAITAIVLIRQARHMQTADYGFDDDRLLVLSLNDADYEPLRNEVRSASGVESVAGINYLPLTGATQGIEIDAARQTEGDVNAIYYAADASLLRQFRFNVVAGSVDAERYRSGRVAVVNEWAVRELGFGSPGDAVGQRVTVHGIRKDSIRAEIVGVTTNFDISFTEGRRQSVVFHHHPDQIHHAVVRYAPDRRADATAAIETAYTRLDPMNPIDVKAAGEVMGQMIRPLVDFSKVLVFIALIAVAIGVAGLLSIATFSVGVRMKEIGIRKALGATVPGLVYQLSSEYVLLVGVGAAIAMPLAWLLNRTWLQNLAVSVDVGVVTRAGVSVVMILLAVATVAPQTVRAALMNPAWVLRDE